MPGAALFAVENGCTPDPRNDRVALYCPPSDAVSP
jgi:hypothetical protein